MGIVQDQIAAYTAALTRNVAAPTGDLGYGSDLSCRDDVTADMAELPGDSPEAIAQANYRRLITPRGSLPDDPDYGLDIQGYLSVGMTAKEIAEIPGEIQLELAKDDRNVESSLAVTLTQGAAGSFKIAIAGETANGPFSLTFAVVDGTAALESINGEAV